MNGTAEERERERETEATSYLFVLLKGLFAIMCYLLLQYPSVRYVKNIYLKASHCLRFTLNTVLRL